MPSFSLLGSSHHHHKTTVNLVYHSGDKNARSETHSHCSIGVEQVFFSFGRYALPCGGLCCGAIDFLSSPAPLSDKITRHTRMNGTWQVGSDRQLQPSRRLPLWFCLPRQDASIGLLSFVSSLHLFPKWISSGAMTWQILPIKLRKRRLCIDVYDAAVGKVRFEIDCHSILCPLTLEISSSWHMHCMFMIGVPETSLSVSLHGKVNKAPPQLDNFQET